MPLLLPSAFTKQSPISISSQYPVDVKGGDSEKVPARYNERCTKTSEGKNKHAANYIFARSISHGKGRISSYRHKQSAVRALAVGIPPSAPTRRLSPRSSCRALAVWTLYVPRSLISVAFLLLVALLPPRCPRPPALLFFWPLPRSA